LQRVRDAKMEEERRMQAERIERSVERAQASTTKKIGKPVMFRAPPVRKMRVAEAVQVCDAWFAMCHVWFEMCHV
jgi:hypothetical protein